MILLNDAQKSAVTAHDGAALVLAGAGSGKTRVIVERLVWLAEEQGVDPRNLLALTFTNRAADEMRTRVAERLGIERLASWVGTFHSFALFVLRRDIDKLGEPKAFTIFDDADQLSLVKRIIKALPSDFEAVSPRQALSWISDHKHDLDALDLSTEPEKPEEKTYREVWLRYHAALKRSSALDFDDLLLRVVRLFEEVPEVVEKYRRRFAHVLVDEYQDTNRAQYRILRALNGDSGNLFVVGDEDQAIYSWRGADIQNILDFEKDFPEAQVFRLEQNYRSTSPILDAANAVVANNTERLGKTLRSEKGSGEPVRFYHAPDAHDEAEQVVQSIRDLGTSYSEVAVLFRTNGQARLIEEVLLRRDIPYLVVGGIRFYARREIKDILCYLRLMVNPGDHEALLRVINVPSRSIGAITLDQIQRQAEAENVSLYDAVGTFARSGNATKAAKAAGNFLAVVESARASMANTPVEKIVSDLIEAVEYQAHVEKSDEKDSRARWEIVEEFVSSCADYDKRERGGLEQFLQDLSLASDTDNYAQGTPAVTLMTCHSAKGLEFNHVFLVGLEEGLLPHGASFGSDSKIEEERRLCYVAMTRACETLHLSAANQRMMYGKGEDRDVSRFVAEIPRDSLQVRESVLGKTVQPASAPRASDDELKTGTRIRHARFGVGTVMFTSGSGNRVKVRIRFDRGGSKQFMVSAAPLEVLKGSKR